MFNYSYFIGSLVVYSCEGECQGHVFSVNGGVGVVGHSGLSNMSITVRGMVTGAFIMFYGLILLKNILIIDYLWKMSKETILYIFIPRE